MKIIKNSDIKFKINKKLVYLPNFTIRFYTVNQKEYFLEKTQDDLVEYEREATVDDVEVILSGGTTVTEYYLPLNWNQLMFVGKGVLNYKLTNNIEDPEFPDYQYNKEEIVTTDFYIDSLEVDPEPEEGLIERIVLLEEHLAEEIVNREEADATITENLNAEEARAISAETELSEALTSETSRAISAETVLDEKIDAETNRATSAETALDEKIDAEETRASGEEQRIEGKLDQEIADRQTDVNAEEARAISAETALDAKIDAETNRATTAESALTDTINAEANRATAAEEALDTKANTISGNVITETTRATAKEDAISGKLDTYIASNDAALQSEVTRATTAEEALQTAINDEATARANADTALQTAITNEVSRASEAESGITNSLNAEVTRATSAEAALDAKIDTVSGNVISETSRATTAEEALSGAIDSLDVRFFDDAKYEDSGNTKVINFYNGNVVKATIDCTDFLVDGMIDNVYIENGYLVIDFNTASGKQDIQIPLTDIFNPNNYYTKSETSGATEISTALAQKLNISDFNTYSGAVDTLINSKASQSDLDALNGVVTAHTADTTVHVTTSDKTKWNKVDDKLDVTDFNTYSGTVDTALAAKQDTLIAGENITISGNVISSEGGGKAIEAGRGISITTGETADTVSFNLPIYLQRSTNLMYTSNYNTLKGDINSYYNSIFGKSNTIDKYGTNINFGCGYNNIFGTSNKLFVDNGSKVLTNNFICGEGNTISSSTVDIFDSFALGGYNKGNNPKQALIGWYNNATNIVEMSFGQYNVSSSASTTFGDSGNTLFSVGNGTAENARHNAFEIRQNGDIYLTKDGQDVKLQDQLGGGGGGTVESAITSGSTNAVESKAIWSAVTYDASINETLEFNDTYAATNYPSGCNSVRFESNTGSILPTGDYVFTSGGSEVAKLTYSVISWWPYEASWTSSDPKLTYVAEGASAVTATYSELAGDIDGVTVPETFTEAYTATASGENRLWINENTYRKDEVYNKSEINVLSGVVDTKLNTISGAVDTKLDATAYTPTVVDSTLNVNSNNPVANSALYDELRIGATETVITFDSDKFSENYPVECRKIKVEVTGTTYWSEIRLLSDKSESGSTDNQISWSYSQDQVSVTLGSGLTEAGATYTISGNTFEVSYPSISNIRYIYTLMLHSYETIKAVTGTSSSVTTLKDQVVENTTALSGKVDTSAITTSISSSSTDAQVPSAKAVNDKLGGLSLVKLTQAQYDALATKDNNTLYVIVG